MLGDPKECRAHAKQCWALASDVENQVLKASLTDLAQKWARLAADLTQRLLDSFGDSNLMVQPQLDTVHSATRTRSVPLSDDA